MAYIDTLPRYYVLDGDIFVKIYRDGDEVKAINHLGVPYPAFNAVRNGVRISREEYIEGVKSIRGY